MKKKAKKEEYVVVLVTAGAGGLEAHDWALLLSRMYVCWAARNGHRVNTLDLDGGNKQITLYGVGIFDALSGERGVHRLVRISPLDPEGRRHTSFAAVDVRRMASVGPVKEAKVNWAGSVRSYIFNPVHQVKDHTTGAETGKVRKVLDGQLELLWKSPARETGELE